MLCHDGHRFECIAINELQMTLTLFVCLLIDTQVDYGEGKGDGRCMDGSARWWMRSVMVAQCDVADLRWAGL